MDHLRLHPRFVALPDASTLPCPTCPADLMRYRQSTVQWWQMHMGRMTTSVAASALGLYEARAAALLGVPRTLRSSRKG
jgi:hypothetical protein